MITPFKDAALYLAEAIESVQRQSGEWELWLVDDGSTDDSLAIAQSYAAADRRLRLLTHPNCGSSASRNRALAKAQGDLVAFLDADDVWLPNMLSLQTETLRLHPQAAMVYANADRWRDNQPVLLSPLIPEGARPGLLEPPTLVDWFRQDESHTPCTCTVVVRTEVARRVGGFEEQFQGLFDDQAFYAKIALSEKVWVNLECLARYRQHEASMCARAWKDLDFYSQERERFVTWLSDYRESLG